MEHNFKQTSIKDNRNTDGTWTKLIETNGNIITIFNTEHRIFCN